MLRPLLKLYRVAFFYLALTGLQPEARSQVTQLSGAQTRVLTNIQNGNTYTILATDCGKLISFTNSGPIAVTIPQAGAAGLAAGCWMDLQNIGPGAITLTPVTSLIDQAASLQLTTNQGLRLVSTGTAYLTQRGQGSGSATGSGNGTVTGTIGPLVSSAIVTGNGGLDIKTPAPAATMDNTGNISIPGTLTTNTSCNGCAGAIDLAPGSDPGAGQLPNSFSWIAPQSIPSAFRWKLPSADAAGGIVSDGAATPGTLSIVPFNGNGSIVKANSPTITTPTLKAPILGSYTVSNLPSGSASGSLAYVTDGSSTADCTTGGGSNAVLCAYNGNSWAFPGTRSVSCQPGLGDGLNAIPAGTYLQSECYNDTGEAITITRIKCFSDDSGSTLTVTNGAGTPLVSPAITCSSSFQAGTQSSTVTLAGGDYLTFAFAANGTTKQTTWVVTELQ